MKKYSETQKKKPFDWNAALAKDCTKFSSNELKKLEDLAGDWVTCACGNQCSIIPRNEKGAPVDRKLNLLGLNFCNEISLMKNAMFAYIGSNYDVDKQSHLKNAKKAKIKAIEYLKKIEEKSTFLINLELESYKKLLSQFGYTVIKSETKK